MRSRFGLATAITIALIASGTTTVALAAAPKAAAVAAVPRPDHVVIVIDENHAEGGIIGNPDAPFITSLANQNANFTQSYAETHPSEPNYLALYSGMTQGLTDDSCPHTYTTPDLGAELIGAGLGFAGYSEGLPSVGYTGCTSGRYARKHNPWVNFPAVPASANQPFTAFPSDYSTLPAVSFVVPNLDNDMHDGTIAEGDTWLQQNMAGYITWAKTHNSLFLLTFDEDDGGAANRVPTILAGQRVVPGSYAETVNHYNVLRTLNDAFGVAPIGNAATATPITDVWSAPAGDQAPTALFSSSCVGLSCSFDGSGSTDPDGSVAGYSWDFGDGTSATGAAPTHTFASGGTYPVVLTVTDDQGASGSVSHSVSVVAPGGTPFASDGFGRSVTGGWGSADVGGVWSTSGTASAFSVAAGVGSVRLGASAQVTTWLGSVSRSDADVSLSLGVDRVPVGGPEYVTVLGRRVSASSYYAALLILNANRSVTVCVVRVVNGVQTLLSSYVVVPGLTFSVGSSVAVRLQVSGTSPTSVRARVWAAGGVEPSAWQVSASDSAAGLQVAGGVGLIDYLSSMATNPPVTLLVTSFTAKPTTVAANQAPTAAFTSSCTQLSCSFNGSGSADADGSLTGYAWDFGDGASGTGVSPIHAYVTGRTYPVRLTVTDNGGASGTITHSVTVVAPPPEQPPTAAFTSSCTQLSCSFDGSSSLDADGDPVVDYAWEFGDGTTGSGVSPPHVYAAAGTYSVRLTVTDEDGATGAVTHSVTVSGPPANQPPTALFSSSCVGLSCSFDGSGSTDPDGSVTGYAWTFGDGSSGTGVSPSHSYAGSGTFTVTLRVTDDQGASGSVSHSVSVVAPGGTPFASDGFGRSVTGGWGSADVGGVWSTSGTASAFSVAAGVGSVRLGASAQVTTWLGSVSRSDADVSLSLGVDRVPVGGPEYVTVLGRRVSASSYYAALLILNANRSVTVCVVRVVNGVQTLLSSYVVVPGLTFSVGSSVAVRLQVSGTSPTSVRARVWAAGGVEPSAWQVSASDSAAGLQVAGGVGLIDYLSSMATNPPVTLLVTSFTAKPTAA